MVKRTSAGVFSPSAFSRSNSSPVFPASSFTWIPVFFVNASIAGSWP